MYAPRFWGPKSIIRGPEDHINIRISHSGSRARYEGHARNHVLWDPHVYVVFWGPHNSTLTAPSGYCTFKRARHRGARSSHSPLLWQLLVQSLILLACHARPPQHIKIPTWYVAWYILVQYIVIWSSIVWSQSKALLAPTTKE